MNDTRSWVTATYQGLADLLTAAGDEVWSAQSLCARWSVREVVAHVTMPVRMTPERFQVEIAAAGGDFTMLSDTVAARDAALPIPALVSQLRSSELHGWLPPGGGAAGALSHAVIHSLDVTSALGRPAVAPIEAMTAVLDQLAAARGALFGIDATGVRWEAVDTGWTWGEGTLLRADTGQLVALLGGRSLPGGPVLPSGVRQRTTETG